MFCARRGSRTCAMWSEGFWLGAIRSTQGYRNIRIEAGDIMATTSCLMTVEQYWQLPEGDASQYELRHGELIKVSRPNLRHLRLQRRLRQLLEVILGGLGIVEIELPFRAL